MKKRLNKFWKKIFIQFWETSPKKTSEKKFEIIFEIGWYDDFLFFNSWKKWWCRPKENFGKLRLNTPLLYYWLTQVPDSYNWPVDVLKKCARTEPAPPVAQISPDLLELRERETQQTQEVRNSTVRSCYIKFCKTWHFKSPCGEIIKCKQKGMQSVHVLHKVALCHCGYMKIKVMR